MIAQNAAEICILENLCLRIGFTASAELYYEFM